MELLSGIIEAFSFPELVSQNGGDIDGLIIAVHLLMLVLFVGWIIYYFVALWKFRASSNPKADYKGVKSKTITNSIEGAGIVAELVLVVVATYYWNFYVNKSDDFSDDSVIRVTAEQFAWSARYPGADGKLGAQSKTLVSGANPFGIDKTDPLGEDDIEVLKSDIVVPMKKIRMAPRKVLPSPWPRRMLSTVSRCCPCVFVRMLSPACAFQFTSSQPRLAVTR